MKQLLLGAALVGIGTITGAVSSDNNNGIANAQFSPPSGQSGDALPRGLSSVINSTHAKPYNTSLPNHHSRCSVG
jgi:hypothetical protein